MKEDKFLSVRPTAELLSAFTYADPQKLGDRTTVLGLALQYVAENGSAEVLTRAAQEEIQIQEDVTLPTSFKVRLPAEEEETFSAAVERFKRAFDLKRVRLKFLMIVSLKAFGSAQRQEAAAKTAEHMVKFGIDPLVFKQEYELSKESEKETLYRLAWTYLEKIDPELEGKIREQVNEQIQRISDFYNSAKYFPPKRKSFGKTNIIFVAKVYAGILLFLAETERVDLGEMIAWLERETENG